MNETLKRVGWAAAWVLSVLVALGIGFWVAAHFLGQLQATPILVRELVEAIQTQHHLEYLDSGATNNARASLVLRMDGHIMVMDSVLADASSEEDRERVKKFLRRVAEHRKKYPAVYPESPTTPDLDQARALVAEILKSYQR